MSRVSIKIFYFFGIFKHFILFNYELRDNLRNSDFYSQYNQTLFI